MCHAGEISKAISRDLRAYPMLHCATCVHCRCKGQQGVLSDTPIRWCVVCSCTGVEGCLLCTEGWSSLGSEVCFGWDRCGTVSTEWTNSKHKHDCVSFNNDGQYVML